MGFSPIIVSQELPNHCFHALATKACNRRGLKASALLTQNKTFVLNVVLCDGLGWHLCRMKLPRKMFNSNTKIRSFEKGLAEGLAPNKPPKTPPKFPRNVSPFSKGGPLGKGCGKEASISGIGRISSRQPPLSANPFSKIPRKVERNVQKKTARNIPGNFQALFSCLTVFHRHFFTVSHPQFQTRFQTQIKPFAAQ